MPIEHRQCDGLRLQSRIVWFLCALAPACVYPAQVLTQSASVVAVQYAMILVVAGLVAFGQRPSSPGIHRSRQVRAAFEPVVWVYVASFAMHILSCVALKQWASYAEARNAVVFSSPIAVYFSARSGSPRGTVLYGLATAGFVTGTLWISEAVHRATSGDVSAFAIQAFEYASQRMGEVQGIEQSNFNRINPTSRVYGVQEFARISATWWAFGVAAVAALFVDSGSSRRTTTTLATGLLVLVACQSVTAIVAFFTAALCAFGLQETRRTAAWLAAAVVILFAIIAAATLTAPATHAAVVTSIVYGASRFSEQALFVFTPVTWSDDSYLQLTLGNISEFAWGVRAQPFVLLIGEFPRLDGSATFHAPGGDTGFLDTISNFGLPLTLLMGFMTIRYIFRARGNLLLRHSIAGPNTRCFVFMIVFVAVMDVHYSVWNDKSIIVALGLLAGTSDAEWRGRRHMRTSGVSGPE